MKKIAIVLLSVLFLSGCGSTEKRMIVVETGANHAIYLDTETGVMYLRVGSDGVCVMVDETGTPLKY